MKKDIVKIIDEYAVAKKDVFMIDIDTESEYESLSISDISNHTRAFVKIQDGCNQFCSYCIIPYTRGRVRSRDAKEIYAEIEALAASGFREVVLTGIHLSSYGIGLENDNAKENVNDDKVISNLSDLIEYISDIEGIDRIRIGSLEPRIIDDTFLEKLSLNKKFCPHFHLSLQSGCDETLKRMNRKYNAKEYYDGVKLIRKYFEDAAITTDVIVGFPGETMEEFDETYRFVDKINFYETHIFPYSIRQGTKAAKMPNQLTNKEKSARAAKLSKLNQEHMHDFRQKRIGKIETILTEDTFEYDNKQYIVGYTKEYVKVGIDAKTCSQNELMSGKITGFLTKDILFMEK